MRHPNIVLVHDFDSQDEIYYMVMEYVEGVTLKDRIEQLSARGEYMPIGEVVSLFQQVSSALDYAHSQGLFIVISSRQTSCWTVKARLS